MRSPRSRRSARCTKSSTRSRAASRRIRQASGASRPAPPVRGAPPSDFRAFAEQWWERTTPELAEATRRGYRWSLNRHLLPYFADLRLDRITDRSIDRYVALKRSGQRPLADTSINTTLTLLGAILQDALQRGLIDRNPARNSTPAADAPGRERAHLETAAHIEALLDAAAELDRAARAATPHLERRAMLATLIFAGLRIGELRALRWRDLDLAAGRMGRGGPQRRNAAADHHQARAQ